MTDQAAQVLAIGVGVIGDEGFQRFVVAGNQAIAPALQGMKAFVVLAGGGVELVDQSQNGVDVLSTHQFADVLNVAFAGDVCGVFGRIGERLAQRVAQRQALDQVGLECGQAFAQFLQRVQLALDLGFALLVENVVVGVFRHGDGPLGNAAMITAALSGRFCRRRAGSRSNAGHGSSYE
ncbi:hypothetical protein SSTU70S_01124 [Stutzerimonas stutzeri]